MEEIQVNLIQCSECKNVVSEGRVEVYDNEIKPGIQARVWVCPHCKHKHLITVMDKAARRMMEANKEDRKKIGNINRVAINQRSRGVLNRTQARNNIDRIEKLEDVIKERTKELDKRMKGLIDEYKGYI